MKRTASAVEHSLPARPTKRHEASPSQPPCTSLSASTSSLSLPPLTPPSRPPPFQQPLPLLTFSYDPSHTLYFDDSSKRYYVDPPPGADLNHGYDKWIRRPDERGRLDTLLRAYDRAREKAKDRPELGNVTAGAVCWRGVMTKILTAPYESRDGFALSVMLLDGTLYLEEHLTSAQLKSKNEMPPRQRTMTYYGYAFESWCTSDTPSPSSGGWGSDVDTNVQWCQVVKTKLGNTRLVMGGEVDCVRPGQNTLVELKTSMAIRGPQDEQRFEKKLLKFYLQSFLLGVPEIVVGFRTPQGYLTTLQSFKTLHLPRMVRGKPGAWDAQICLSWGNSVLDWLRAELSRVLNAEEGEEGSRGESPRVWRATFTAGEGVRLAMLDEEEVKNVEDGEDRVGFLPRWYWDQETAKSGDGTTASAKGVTIGVKSVVGNGDADRRISSLATDGEGVVTSLHQSSAQSWKI